MLSKISHTHTHRNSKILNRRNVDFKKIISNPHPHRKKPFQNLIDLNMNVVLLSIKNAIITKNLDSNFTSYSLIKNQLSQIMKK